METITVEAVTTKFANKYNSGSVKVGDKWLQVAKNVDINAFQKGTTIDVETKTNDKGYTSIVGLATSAGISGSGLDALIEKEVKAAKSKKAIKPVEENTLEIKPASEVDPYYVRSKYGEPMSQYEVDLDKRISLAGIVQACIISPSLAGLPYTTVGELAKNAQALAEEMIAFVESKLK